jgi:CRP-like cAMP-binding protein
VSAISIFKLSNINSHYSRKVLFLDKSSPDVKEVPAMRQPTETAHVFPRLRPTARLDLLSELCQQATHEFNTRVRTRKCRRGDWIFVLGDPADSIYLLQEGRMKLTALSEDGHEVLHEIIGAGEIFGDTSAILGIPRTTSAQALEASLLCEIRRKDFESLLTAYPEMSLQLLKSVGLRLKRAEAQLLNVVCNDVSTRVREALINLIAIEPGVRPDQPVRIGITQQDLANLIGASRQKTWQALKELESSNVLRLTYGSILVTAPHKLRNEQSPERHVNEQLRSGNVAISRAPVLIHTSVE